MSPQPTRQHCRRRKARPGVCVRPQPRPQPQAQPPPRYRRATQAALTTAVAPAVVALLAAFFVVPHIAAAQAESEAIATGTVIEGTVVEVRDGDTVEVDIGSQTVPVRLHGIDSPESNQPYGERATRYTSELSLGRRVRVEVLDRDQYGRLVGVVELPDGESLNEALVEAGLAWWYRRYAPNDATLEKLEERAREAGRGLWSDPGAVAPWDWRRGERGDRD